MTSCWTGGPKRSESSTRCWILPDHERHQRARAACGDDARLWAVVERLLAVATDDGDLPGLPDDLLDDPASHEVPTQVGSYRLLDEIGRGGMSRVFRAVLDGAVVPRPVALKLLDRRPTPGALRRFDRERDTLARLVHPHIARLIDGGVAVDGTPYLVMDLVEGRPIDAHCDHRALGVLDRLRLFRQVLVAVEFAHAQLIVHRDIKPANVFVDAYGSVKLLDFGIAKWLDDAADASLTQTQHRVLTPAHAAPEQFRGEPITAATDVYQLGLLLYQLLTGRPAHVVVGSTHDAIAHAVLDSDPPPPSQAVRPTGADTAADAGGRTRAASLRGATTIHALARRLSGDLDAILLKALRKAPGERYASVEAFRRDLDDFLASRPVSARRGTLLYAARKYAVRHRASVAAAAAATLALVVGFVAVVAQAQATAAERDRARLAEARASAVNRYLVRDLLAAATPAGAQGRTVSVADVLANGSRSVSYAFAGQPLAEADVRTTLSDSYAALGQYADAETHARAARVLLEEVTPRDEAAVLRARAQLARLAFEQGRFAEARAETEAVLATQTAAAGAYDVDSLLTATLLSRVLRRQGELAKAERIARDVLAATSRYPDDWRLGAEARSRLADVLIDLRKGEEAEPLTREALELKRANLGPAHPEVLAAMSQQVLAVDALLRFDQGLALATQLAAIFEQVYGPDHPQTARAHNSVAVAHDRLGHDREARVEIERALAIYRKSLGPTHTDTIGVLRNLGILVGRTEPARAEPIYREVLAARLDTLGPAHADTIGAARGLATLLDKLPHHRDARPAALRLLDLCDGLAQAPSSDPRGLDSCATYLLDLSPPDLRDPARALRLAEQATAVEGRTQDRRLQTVARAQLALGDHAAALATMREALDLPDALQSWTAEELYVELLTAHGSAAELEAWLLTRLQRFAERRGPGDPLMSKTERHLALYYERTGRLAEAEARFRAVVERLGRARPDIDFELGRAMSELGGVLQRRGALDEAESLLLRGFDAIMSDRRAGPETRGEARDRLVRLYETWQRPGDAERWRQRSLAPAADPAVAR